MVDLTRRGFLRTASISAAAMGAIGVLPSLAHAEEPGVGLPSPVPAAGSAVPMPVSSVPGSNQTVPMVVYIDNPASGKGVIFIGEQGITFESPAIVQSLQSAMA